MSNVFDFRRNHSIKGVNPQAVGEALESIRKARGTLTPADVVEEARDQNSPLHNAFEWDDTAAAHQYRLSQARKLIVSIRVINSPAQAIVPAFVSVRTPEQGRSYVPTVEALSDEQLRARVLQEVQQFIEGLERRYSNFREVADILQNLKKGVG